MPDTVSRDLPDWSMPPQIGGHVAEFGHMIHGTRPRGTAVHHGGAVVPAASRS
jgi:hypothetical protein